MMLQVGWCVLQTSNDLEISVPLVLDPCANVAHALVVLQGTESMSPTRIKLPSVRGSTAVIHPSFPVRFVVGKTS